MPRTARRRAGIVTAALAAAAIAAGPLWSAAPARAHDQLIDSTPSSGEVVPIAPEEVVLQFSIDLIELGGIILVADENDASWTEGELVYDGPRVRIALRDDMPDGWYEIRWQVVSGDGHPINGTIPFAIGQAGPRPGGATPTDVGTPVAQDDAPSGMPAPLRIALVGAAGAAIALGAYLLIRRLRRTDGEPDSP